MSLKVNIVNLQKKSERLSGEISAEELGLESRDELVEFGESVQYELNADWMDKSVLVQGSAAVSVDCECVRCLKPFTFPITLEALALHLPVEGTEAVEIIDDCIDLTPYIREDILLGLPQHPLCRSDCEGLPKGNSLQANTGSKSSIWSELDNLKFRKD
jgi:uncharacterized metal-binding protein YceD (DUF177 family)